MKKINVGVIGAGRIGKLHSEVLLTRIPEANLVKIAEPNEESLKVWKDIYNLPDEMITADYKEILEADEIEAVLICSPTNMHAQMIIESAQAGKQIFCEKPIDFDLNMISEALQAVESTGVKLQIGFNRRFDPSFRNVHKRVAKGDIGDPHIVKITSRDPAPPPLEYVKVSGGIFLDMMIHDFDMARYLSGQEVTEVRAIGDTLINKDFAQYGDVDTAIVTLKFANGTMGVIDNSRQAIYGYDQRVEVFGTQGCLRAANEHPNTVTYYGAKTIQQDNIPYFFLERYMTSFTDEMTEFINCISQDKKPLVTGEDGLKAALIALAATQSLKEGKSIKISDIEG